MLLSFLLQQAPANSPIAGFLPIVLIIFVFYFFMIRPQINRQRAEDQFRSEIKKGDRIVTMGGIHGKVNSIKGTNLILEIGENNRIKIDLNAVSREKTISSLSNK